MKKKIFFSCDADRLHRKRLSLQKIPNQTDTLPNRAIGLRQDNRQLVRLLKAEGTFSHSASAAGLSTDTKQYVSHTSKECFIANNK